MADASDSHADNNSPFLQKGEEENCELVENITNYNTKRKTISDCKIFTEWLATNNEFRRIEEISPKDLDNYLARFFLTVRSKKGEEYEPDTIKAIQTSVSRYLLEKTNWNIIKDREFQHSRDMLKAKRKQLKRKGMGNKKRKADPFTPAEIDILFNKGLLGTDHPDSLVNTVWLNNTLYFGMRSRLEHCNMLLGDIELKSTSSGEQYLEYTEKETKAKKGQSGSTRAFAPKMFAKPNDPRCPVKTFVEFIRRRPTDCMQPDGRFYLRVLQQSEINNDSDDSHACWYSKQPMGKNTLGTIVKRMAEKAKLPGRKGNDDMVNEVVGLSSQSGKLVSSQTIGPMDSTDRDSNSNYEMYICNAEGSSSSDSADMGLCDNQTGQNIKQEPEDTSFTSNVCENSDESMWVQKNVPSSSVYEHQEPDIKGDNFHSSKGENTSMNHKTPASVFLQNKNEDCEMKKWKMNCLNNLKSALRNTMSGLEDLGAEVAAWVIIPDSDYSTVIDHMGSKRGLDFIKTKPNIDTELHQFLQNSTQTDTSHASNIPTSGKSNTKGKQVKSNLKTVVQLKGPSKSNPDSLQPNSQLDSPSTGTCRPGSERLRNRVLPVPDDCLDTTDDECEFEATDDIKDNLVAICTELFDDEYAKATEKPNSKFPYKLLKMRGKPWFTLTGFPDDLLPFRHPSLYDVNSLKRIVDNQAKIKFNILHRKLADAYCTPTPCDQSVKSALQQRLSSGKNNAALGGSFVHNEELDREITKAIENNLLLAQGEQLPGSSSRLSLETDNIMARNNLLEQSLQKNEGGEFAVSNNAFHIQIKEEPVDYDYDNDSPHPKRRKLETKTTSSPICSGQNDLKWDNNTSQTCESTKFTLEKANSDIVGSFEMTCDQPVENDIGDFNETRKSCQDSGQSSRSAPCEQETNLTKNISEASKSNIPNIEIKIEPLDS